LAAESRRNRTKAGSVGVLISGGADSGVLLVEMTKTYRRVFPIYVRNGLFWEKAELYWLRRFIGRVDRASIRPLKILELPMQDIYQLHWSLTGQKIPDHASSWTDVYLPGRNLILLSKAAVFCALNRIPEIALGPLKTNLFPDSTRSFFDSFQKVVEKGLGTRLRVLAPFARKKKAEVLRIGRHLPLEMTFSCLNPRGKNHCGVCNKCAERMEAFKEAGLSDRTVYHDGRIAVRLAAVSSNGRRQTSNRRRSTAWPSRRVSA
jgi:7-cyano-7-deazaguanine synthase